MNLESHKKRKTAECVKLSYISTKTGSFTLTLHQLSYITFNIFFHLNDLKVKINELSVTLIKPITMLVITYF